VGQVIGDGPLAQIIFTEKAVTDYRSTASGDRVKSRAMMLGLFERGVFVNPMGTKMYASLAHDRQGGDADAIPEFLETLTQTLRSIGR
jgi:glutamate-1-semialdehyde 2,1-aminomutase